MAALARTGGESEAVDNAVGRCPDQQLFARHSPGKRSQVRLPGREDFGRLACGRDAQQLAVLAGRGVD